MSLRRVESTRATLRRPYGCRRFCDVDSTNLASVGILEDDLVVRFHSGGVYRYRGLAVEFDDLISAESKGKHFHRRIRSSPVPGERLCAVYGCVELPKRSQVLCERHFEAGPVRR
jgi:hypothetical protein